MQKVLHAVLVFFFFPPPRHAACSVRASLLRVLPGG
jgi:hypothetical protein